MGSAPQQPPPIPDATALNPLVLLEVTSDNSDEYDTNGTLEAYKGHLDAALPRRKR